MIKIQSSDQSLSVEWVVNYYTIRRPRNPEYPSHCWICKGKLKPSDEVAIVHTADGRKALHGSCWHQAQEEAAERFYAIHDPLSFDDIAVA